MKKIWTFIALFIGIGFVASAQTDQTANEKGRRQYGKVRQERVEKRTPEEIAKMRTERLDKKLNFSEQQRSEIYAYHLDKAKKFDSRAEAAKKDRQIRRQEMQADRDKLKEILTPEQQELLAKDMREGREKMTRERRGNHDKKRSERPRMHRKMEKERSVEENTNS